MVPEFYPHKTGGKINLFKVHIADPKARYRKEIEPYIPLGKIPDFERIILTEVAQHLGLTAEEAEAIETGAFAAVRKREEKQERYRQVYEAAFKDAAVSKDLRKKRLERLRQLLGLTKDEVEKIEVQVRQNHPLPPQPANIAKPSVPSIPEPQV